MIAALAFVLTLIPFVRALPRGSQREEAKCSSFEPLGYYCVPYFLCNNTGYIVTDGGAIFDDRSSDALLLVEHENVLSSRCDALVQVCCRHPNFGKTNEENYQVAVSDPLKSSGPKPKCGKRNEEGVGGNVLPRQLEKTTSQFGEWPHVCLVMKEEDTGNGLKISRYQCVGSLIAEGVVLTAAHCVKEAFKNNEPISVRCGEWDVTNEDEIFPYQEREVAETIIHPKFGERNLHYDFALLITEEDFEFDEHINPVCLPSPEEMLEPKDCVSLGWGKDRLGKEGKYQKKLKEVKLPLVDHQECQSRLRKTRLGQFFQLDDSFICAGGEKDIDTCEGDGGGPLTCLDEESNEWFQAGVVAWGIGCGNEGTPAVYASVAKAVCWMDYELTTYFEMDSHKSFLGHREDCPQYFSNVDVVFDEEPSCGKRNLLEISPQIDMGTDIPEWTLYQEDTKSETLFGEWPHVCAVVLEDMNLNIFRCGGSLINPRVILTAAHCVRDALDENLLVRCGEWDTNIENERFPYQERNVESVKIHPEYSSRTLHWDVALLVTKTAFTITNHINPVCLPSPKETFGEMDCVANGWGKDKFGMAGRFEKTLKQVNLPLVDHEECQENLRKSTLGRGFHLDDSFICAGGKKGADTCTGDGGGPLTCQRGKSGPWVQAGIVSWGIGCGEEGTPAVYASVSKAVCWMDRVLSCHFRIRPGVSFLGFKQNCEEEFSKIKC